MNNGRHDVERLEQDVDRIRSNIGELVRELDFRRHRAFDLKLQFRRRGARLVAIGATIVGLVAGAIALAITRRRRRHSVRARVAALRDALRRIAAHPERVAASKPNVTRKIAAAGGSALASVLGKRLARRLASP